MLVKEYAHLYWKKHGKLGGWIKNLSLKVTLQVSKDKWDFSLPVEKIKNCESDNLKLPLQLI